jgi:alkylation response protein AidB-like acyl-CoA dehydrogenase
VSTDETASEMEDLEAFRQRARTWIRDNLRHIGPKALALEGFETDEEELAVVAHDRDIQRKLFDAGLAGICVPKEYGGQGLSRAHQLALCDEMAGYDFPMRLQSPTFSPCLPVILEFGTEEQKQRHVPAMLKGEAAWMQFLSEPSGGSDVAGALTTAVRDGDEWVLNGSKIWTTGAWWSDWGLCLARTNWDVPKHRGLTVFMLPIHQPGIEVHRIEMLNGNKDFCQEFITDVRIPDTDRIGEVNDGWTVGIRWMFHERMLLNSPFVTLPTGTPRGGNARTSLLGVAEEAGRLDDPVVRDLLGEARMLDVVGTELQRRLGEGIATGTLSSHASGIGRLFSGTMATRRTTIAFEIAGGAGAVWGDDDDAELTACGNNFLLRQVAQIGGGTTEMARNVISERVLGMPRERTLDRDVAFREVPRSPSGR